MSVLTGSVDKPRVFWMWVGVLADFRELLRTIEAQFEPLLDAHVDKATETLRGTLEFYQKSLAETEAQLKSDNEFIRANAEASIENDRARVLARESEFERAVQEARYASKLRAEVTERDGTRRTYIDTADSLADALSRRKFKTMTISGPTGSLRGYSIILSIDPRDEVRINVSSTEERWGEAAFGRILSHMRDNVPWWRWVRKARVNSPILFVSTFLAWVIGWSGVFNSLSSNSQGFVALGAGVVSFLF